MKSIDITINLAELPECGSLIVDGDTSEVITYSGIEPPVIYKGKVIKPGKLLKVKRNLPPHTK